MKINIIKISCIALFFSIKLFCVTSLIASQRAEMLKEIKISSSTSLILEMIAEPVEKKSVTKALPLPPGIFYLNPDSSLAKDMRETYIISLKISNLSTELDRIVFQGPSSIYDGAGPRLAIRDAVIEGNHLYYLFESKGQVFLGTASMDRFGKVSGSKQKPLPDTILWNTTARFVKAKNGKATLKIRQPGKKEKAFQFSDTGEAFNVPSE